MKCFLIIILLISAFVLFILKYPLMEETMGTKEEWSNLSSIQSLFSSLDKKNRVEISKKFSKEVLIVKGDINIFILLNVKSPPFYKQLPVSGNYYLSFDEYQSIKEQANKMTPTVDLILQSRINDK